MTYTEHDFSLKSEIKKIVLTPDLVLTPKSDFTKIVLTPDFPLLLTL